MIMLCSGYYFGHYFVKDYKPTLISAKGKWYVSMTVPTELRQILGGQIKLSTGTSDKNEAQKRLPELAMKLKQKISDASSQFENNELRNGLNEIATKLGRASEFDFTDTSTENLTFIVKKLKSSESYDQIQIGKFSLGKIRKKLKDYSSKPTRISFEERKEQIRKLGEISNFDSEDKASFEMIANDWAEKKNWQRQKSKKTFYSYISYFISVVGNLRVEEIKPITIYNFAEYLAEDKGSPASVLPKYDFL